METQSPKRVLVVANRTAAAPRLLDEVTRHARNGAAGLTLLIPDVKGRKAADWTIDAALPLLRRAARGKPVDTRVGGPDPFEAVKAAVEDGGYDEIVISTLPKQTSKWLRGDLIKRVEKLGLPVTAIVPRSQSMRDAIENSDDVRRQHDRRLLGVVPEEVVHPARLGG
jgi:hypothetical protein